MINPEIFSANQGSTMVWQWQAGAVTHRIEKDSKGYRKYIFYPGKGKGNPVHGPKWQTALEAQTKKVAEALK